MSGPHQFHRNPFALSPRCPTNLKMKLGSSPHRLPSSPQSAKQPFSPGTFKSSHTPELSSVEVLRMDEERMDEITQVPPNSKNSWLPWKRPNRRDQQLRHLREGYIELLGLVRSISGHLDRQKDEKSQVTELAESLPPALRSFETLADSQKEVTSILGSLNCSYGEDRCQG